MGDLGATGLGLDHGTVRFGRTTETWVAAGNALSDETADLLTGIAVQVEAIGSSSVLGLLAKPIIDLAVGRSAEQPLTPILQRLETAGWIYRGDAGDNGGHVFVLEARPRHRWAHLHLVEFDGRQWQDYLRFRDLLRRSATARQQYEAQKRALAQLYPGDRRAYTEGKTQIVNLLLTNPPFSL
jgi:GrpB-like predicted nucleotidyltransferase (UPF0157 family)